ncbi:MAG: indolepyruvate oxidoreductase subunit beta, partial [Clostridia bacterium]|nr:indolepyruvate oxidoreductase subunit beta [Clostridia bacterium]
FINLGLDVKMSEVHGMAQRGGSVVTHVRCGERVNSPLVEIGGADYILAFEALEALRSSHYLKEDGQMIVNSQHILPMPVILGKAEYPEKTINSKNVKYMDALKMAEEIGNTKTVNVILIGALAKQMDNIDKEKWIEAIRETVKPKFIDVNVRAFEAGYNA